MKPAKVAIIDDGINPLLIMKNCFCYEIVNSEVKTVHEWLNVIGHATRIASVITERCKCYVNIYSIKIFEHTLEPVNIGKLAIAINWCLKNDIDVINLSIGSIQFTDRVRFTKIMTEVEKKGIIVVSAYSNDNLLTFPASLNSVIGVKHDALGYLHSTEHVYCENSIDGIEIVSGCQDSFFGMYHEKCNSFATAEITSKVCNYISQVGRSALTTIKDFLKNNSKNKYSDKYIYYGNLENKQLREITQPVIYMENHTTINDDSLIDGIISAFMEVGYNCVGIGDQTSIEKNIFALPYSDVFVDHTADNSLAILNSFVIPDIWLVGNVFMKSHFKPELFDLYIHIMQECIILKWDENVKIMYWESGDVFDRIVDKILKILE